MITIKDLGFSYGEIPVLKNITMTLEEGRIYGLLGENGVGKTTLLTLLCGLKKPQTGSIDTDGKQPYDREPSLLSDQYYLSDEVAPMNMKAVDYARNYGKFWEGFSMDKFMEVMAVLENDPQQKMNHMSFGQLKKTYHALVFGGPEGDSGIIDAPIARRPLPSLLRFVDISGKPSVTEFTVLQRQGSTSLLALRPVTGRTHQLRVHCAHMGYPILGDPQYGSQESALFSQQMGLEFQRLCARQITFTHPITGETMTIEV